MAIKHEWQTTRNLPASVSCSGPSVDVPGTVSIDVPEDPLQSERMTMALEILRLKQQMTTLRERFIRDIGVIDFDDWRDAAAVRKVIDWILPE